MKIKTVSSLLAASLGLMFAGSAMAVDGTINFSGEITSNTCKVSINDSGNNQGLVTLPTVSASALPAVGAVAGATPFNINLTDCSISDAATVSTYFEPGAYVNTSGRLSQSTPGGAANVEIELLNSALGVINASAASGSQNDTGVPMVQGDTAATLSYYAQYYATGAVTAGAVSSEVSYTIVYE